MSAFHCGAEHKAYRKEAAEYNKTGKAWDWRLEGTFLEQDYTKNMDFCAYFGLFRETKPPHKFEHRKIIDAKYPYKTKGKLVLPKMSRKGHDLIIFVLEKPVTFTKKIQPICLPQKDLSVNNRKLVVTGWGETQDSRTAKVLKKLKVICCGNDTTKELLTITPEKINDVLQLSCHGDSGIVFIFTI